MARLYNVDSPIDREQRNNLNLTFTDILARFSNLQTKVQILTPGRDLDEVLERINSSTNNANAAAENAENILETFNAELPNLMQVINDAAPAIENIQMATQLAEEATALANDVIALTNAATVAANEATTNARESTSIANAAADSASTATNSATAAAQSANTAANRAELISNDLEGFGKVIMPFNMSTFFLKNQPARYNGNTFRAKIGTVNNPLPILPVTENEWWVLEAQRGVDGNGSVSAVNNVSPNTDGNVDLGVDNIEGLTDTINDLKTFANKEIFTATNGQTVFNLVDGTYVPNDNRISVMAGGVEQYSPTNFTETSESSITFTQPLPIGTIVVINYYSKFIPIQTNVEGRLLEIENNANNFVTKESGKGLSTNDYTSAEKTKLTNVQAGAQVNAVTSVNGQTGAVTVQGFSGNYNDLTNKPTLFSGNYNDLTNKPVIPTIPEFTNIINDEITIYVSNSGLDNNTGLSESTPVKTIAKAVELVKNLGAKKRVIQLEGAHVFNETVTLKEIHGGTLEINGTYDNRATVKGFIFENCSANISVLHIDVMVKGAITSVGDYGAYIRYCDRVSLYFGTWQGMSNGVTALDSRVYVSTITFNNVIGAVIDTSRGSFVYVDGLLGANPATTSSTYNAYSSIIMGNAGTITSALAQRKSAGGQIFF